MKNFAKRTIKIVCAAAAIVTAPAMAVTVSIDPATQIQPLGSTVSVDILISDLGDFSSPSLASFDLFVGYDASVLSPTAAAYGTQLNDNDPAASLQFGLVLESGPNGAGTCAVANCFEVGEISFLTAQELNDNQPADFLLATVSFDTLSLGTSLLTFQFSELFDETDSEIPGVILLGGSITVEAAPVAVPLPASLLLFSSMLFWRRRKS